MLELSAKLEYSLLALIELSKHYESKKTTGTREIATNQNIPDRYLDQILADLKRSGIVESFRGANGGHRLSRSSKDITMAQIVKGIDPDKVKSGRKQNSPSRRAVLYYWEQVRQEMEQNLHKITLEDLYRSSQSYEQSPPMYYI